MSDYPKMLYLGDDRVPFMAYDADHEATLIGAMSRTEPAATPEPEPESITDHPESDAKTPRRKKAK